MGVSLKEKIKSALLRGANWLLNIEKKVSSIFNQHLEKKIEEQKRKFYLKHHEEMEDKEIDEFKYNIFLGYGFIAFVILITASFLIGGQF